MPSSPVRVLLAAVLLLAGGPSSASAFDAILSPSVLANSFFRQGEEGLQHLEFLVLWRGRPGWFVGPGPSQSSSRTSPDSYTSWARRGGIELEVQVDLRRGTATVQGVLIDLHRGNVVLVDNVGDGSRGTIIGIAHVEAGVLWPPGSDPAERLLPILGAVPDFPAFLQCARGDPGRPGLPNLCPRLAPLR